MCEPPETHIPHVRPCPETFSGLPRLEKLQLCQEVGLGSTSNVKWESSPSSTHPDRFCLPEDFSKLDWTWFGSLVFDLITLNLELGLIFLFQTLVNGPWKRLPPPWEPPSLGSTPLFSAEWPSSWPSREFVGLSSVLARLLRILRRPTLDMTLISHRQPPRPEPRPRRQTTPDPEVGGGVPAPVNVLPSLRRMTRYTAGMNQRIISRPRPQICKLSTQKSAWSHVYPSSCPFFFLFSQVTYL